MAERRMFAKTIVMSDAFLDMPATARCLYFTLGMFADDDGFVNSPKSIMRQCGASMDDMNVLIAKKFVYIFDSGVIVIKHWRINNLLRADRHHPTAYTEELNLLTEDKNGAYTLSQPNDNQLATNGQPSADIIGLPSIGKDSIGKDSKGKVSKDTDISTLGEIINSMPTIADITDYISSKHYKVNPQRFYEYYTTEGRSFPQHWESVVDKWEQSEFKRTPKKHTSFDTERKPSTNGFGMEYFQ